MRDFVRKESEGINQFDIEKFNIRGIEAEFTFSLGKDLPSRNEVYTVDEVIDAIEFFTPSIEICASRFEDTPVDVNLFLSDFGGHGFLILSDNVYTKDEIQDINLEDIPVKMTKINAETGDKIVAAEGFGKDVLGSPLHSLAWLANHLARYTNVGLSKGHIICTGTCTGLLPVSKQESYLADFGPLGDVKVSF